MGALHTPQLRSAFELLTVHRRQTQLESDAAAAEAALVPTLNLRRAGAGADPGAAAGADAGRFDRGCNAPHAPQFFCALLFTSVQRPAGVGQASGRRRAGGGQASGMCRVRPGTRQSTAGQARSVHLAGMRLDGGERVPRMRNKAIPCPPPPNTQNREKLTRT